MIGSALYAALGTRSDIMYAIQRLAQFTAHPKPKHWTALKRIFRYLKGTRDYALTYGGFDQEWTRELSIYCDADWDQTRIGNQSADTLLRSQEALSLGVQRSNQQLHYQRPKRNM